MCSLGKAPALRQDHMLGDDKTERAALQKFKEIRVAGRIPAVDGTCLVGLAQFGPLELCGWGEENAACAAGVHPSSMVRRPGPLAAPGEGAPVSQAAVRLQASAPGTRPPGPTR